MIGVDLVPGNPARCQQRFFFQLEVHQRHGQRRVETLRRFCDHLAKPNAVELNRGVVRVLVQHKMSPNGHTKPRLGQAEVNVAVHDVRGLEP